MARKWLIRGGGLLLVASIIALVWYSVRPQRVVEGAVAAFGAAETADIVARLEFANAATTEQLLGEQGVVELVLDGAYARHEAAPDDFGSTIELTAKTESVSVNLTGEVRFINDALYVFIEKAPSIYPALAQLKGTWLQLPRGAGEEQPVVEPLAEPLFTAVERAGVEERQGEQVVVYRAVATEAAVIRLMDSIAALLGTNLTAEQIASVRGSVEQAGSVPVEIAVKRWSRQLRELSANLDIPGGNAVHFSLIVEDMGQPVTVSVPEGAVTLQQALTTPAVPAQ